MLQQWMDIETIMLKKPVFCGPSVVQKDHILYKSIFMKCP